MITRGSYVHKPMVKFLGASRKLHVFLLLQISQSMHGFKGKKQLTRLLKFIKLYTQKQIIFTYLFTKTILWL